MRYAGRKYVLQRATSRPERTERRLLRRSCAVTFRLVLLRRYMTTSAEGQFALRPARSLRARSVNTSGSASRLSSSRLFLSIRATWLAKLLVCYNGL